jgi:AcrR family transcriptional regulator
MTGVMPRRSAADAALTRATIIDRSVAVASVEGLEGLTIGRLATDLDMSKAGVIGHFGTKEELQLAALSAARATYKREVWDRAAAVAPQPGRARLLAIADAWMSYLARDVFPGGCFITAASCEFDDRPGRVREAIRAQSDEWLRVLAHEAKAAVAAGDLPRGTRPDDVAFTMNAIAMGTNQARHLREDPDAPARGWRAMRTLLHAPHARRRFL